MSKDFINENKNKNNGKIEKSILKIVLCEPGDIF